MAYHISTANVLVAAGYTVFQDFSCGEITPTTVALSWFHTDPKPTEQQISDYATDAVALPSGQLFSAWLAENGGDVTQTARRIAREEVDDTSGIGIRTRALIELLNKRDNYLTNRIVELQDALDAMKASTGAVQNVRDAIPSSWMPTATRNKAAAVQDYKDDINAGNQDG